jgi:ABC-type Fe3+-siderophore transport system permease subunit
MSTEFKQRYWIAAAALVVCAGLSLFLKLDYSNASLILKELRIPRLILAISVGGALALSGVVMQTVLSNPLADPYTLGIASGAALGAAIGTTLGLKLSFFGLNVGAVFGAGLVLLALLRIVKRSGEEPGSMILIGVMLSLTCASLLAIWMALADPMGVQSINFWLLGDLSRVGLMPAVALFILTAVISGYFYYFSKKLDAFLFGESLVDTFGVSLDQTRKISILLISVLVGFCVSAVGMIGFVGLVVPHLVRRQIRTSRHQHLIPLSILWGAVILTLSDVLAKSVGEPHELPVGAVTAVVGAPVFIWLFVKRSRGSLA